MGIYQAIGASNSSEIGNKTAFPDAIANIPKEGVRASVHNVLAYGADIVNPLFQGGKNLLHTFNPYSMSRNGIIKNTIKSPLSAALLSATALKNAGLGIGSGVRHLYRHGVQNNITHAVNGTVGKVPFIGPYASKAVGHTANAVSAIIGTPLAAYDWTARKLDNGANYVTEKTLLQGQSLKESRMRQGTVSSDGLKVYGDGNAELTA